MADQRKRCANTKLRHNTWHFEELEDRRMLAAFDVLVLTETASFRHASIDEGVALVEQLGASNGFSVTEATDSSGFTPEGLKDYEVVVFMNTSGNILTTPELQALLDFVDDGGGFVGVHAAADTQRAYPTYLDLVGAEFWTHPNQQTATILVEDGSHASTAHLPDRWTLFEEWYDFQANPRGDVQVLLSIDTTTYQGHQMGKDHPISWYQYYGGGRSWYTGLGNREDMYSNLQYQQHVLGGIQFAAGMAPADQGGGLDENYEKVVLVEDTINPLSLDIANDGSVYFVELTGAVKKWDVNADEVTELANFNVDVGGENGLLGIALDPHFETTGWLYLFYTPKTASGEQQMQRISRWTYNGSILEPGSESVLIEYASSASQTPHTAGSLAFGPDGLLYISTGDDTNSSSSNGYAPIDERPGKEYNDAQRTAANNNDYRGSILRIKPEVDGTYSIPTGNLFPADGSAGLPEIYVMGVRNPFRISVDQKNGWLYWGDVGPDAGFFNGDRGPEGHDEINQARSAGNFGWPYLLADNKPYRDYDFATGEFAEFYDPNSLVNDSPNNTGSTILPNAEPALIWYPYDESGYFPEFGGPNGRTAMAGPVYNYDEDLQSENKLPESFDNTLFVYEWSRNLILQVKLDGTGDILKINPFLEGHNFNRPIDMELGPDGALYIIEWGMGFGGGNSDAQIVRIDFQGNLPELIGDYNGDAYVDAADYSVWRNEFGVTGASPADGDNNGVVNYADYVLWADRYSDTTILPIADAGDYNDDGVVDAADFTVWRNAEGTNNPAADGNQDGIVNSLDYDLWVANYGKFILPEDPFLGDYNNDSVVDAKDYTVWRDSLATGDLVADGNQDGVVDLSDYETWVANYGKVAPPAPATAEATPEESSAVVEAAFTMPTAAYEFVGPVQQQPLALAKWALPTEENEALLLYDTPRPGVHEDLIETVLADEGDEASAESLTDAFVARFGWT